MQYQRPERRRASDLLLAHSRRAVVLHRGPERLGNLPAPRRRHDQDAEGRADEHARLPSREGRRALGAAGAAGESQRAASGLPEAAVLATCRRRERGATPAAAPHPTAPPPPPPPPRGGGGGCVVWGGGGGGGRPPGAGGA